MRNRIEGSERVILSRAETYLRRRRGLPESRDQAGRGNHPGDGVRLTPEGYLSAQRLYTHRAPSTVGGDPRLDILRTSRHRQLPSIHFFDDLNPLAP